jgi:hypothetical protein
MKRLIAIVVTTMLASLHVDARAEIDPRLATVKKAFVIAIDDLADDRPVSACFVDHLKTATPIEAVSSTEEADVVFRVRANIPSATKRVLFGGMGGSPSAHLYAELPDGTKLWDDGAKLRRVLEPFGRLKGSDEAKGVECGLADELLDRLRDAMREARKK